MSSFRVGVTKDFLNPDGELGYGDIGLGVLSNAPEVEWEFLEENVSELTAELTGRFDGLLVLAPRVTEAVVRDSPQLKVIARFGVGYDRVDVDACTRHGVLLTITPNATRRPVAVSALTLLLALSHKLRYKDQLTRSGRWNEKLNYMGQGLSGRTLGIVGLGNIGTELARLAAPFDLKLVASDPNATAEAAGRVNVTLMSLDELLRTADYVVITCALVEATRHLINQERIALMKSSAYLINVARGPIVDQEALTKALSRRSIQGAGLDVFEQEPVDPSDPILGLDNVIVSPHALCWTDELFLANGTDACTSIVEVSQGKVPEQVVNREVLDAGSLRMSIR